MGDVAAAPASAPGPGADAGARDPAVMPAVPAAFGFAAQATQVVLARELLAVFHGNEAAIGLVFAVWLFWVAVGGVAGGRWGSWRALPAAAAIQLALLPAAVFLVRDLRAWFDVPAGQYLPLGGLALASAAVFALPCLGFGVQFSWTARASRNPGRTYALEAAGAALGAAGVALLAPAAGSFALLAAAVAAPFAALLPSSRRAAVAGLAGAVALAVCAPVLDRVTQERAWRWLGPEAVLVAALESPHGPLAAVERAGEISLYRGGRLYASLPDRGEDAPLACLILLQATAPRRVLLAGGSATLLDEAGHHGIGQIDLVEPDTATFDLLRRLAPGRIEPANVRLRTGDPRRLLRAEDPYDVVIVCAGEPDTAAANRCYTVEFFREARQALAPGGVLAVGPLAAGAGYSGDETLERNATVYRTARAVFPRVAVTPGSAAWLLATATAALTLDETEVPARAWRRGRRHLDLARFTERFWVDKAAAEFAGGRRFDPLGEAPPPSSVGPVNEDARPLAYFQSTRVWAWHAGDAVAGVLAAAAALPAWPWVLLAAAPALTRRKAGAMFAVGFAGMAVSLGALLAFQARVGELYQALGLLLAAYMAGSAAGSRLRLPPRAALALVAVAGLGLAAATGAASLTALMAAAGAAVGAAYAALAGERDAAFLYAADVAGGCLAALVVVPVLLPLHGTYALVAAAVVPVALAAVLLRGERGASPGDGARPCVRGGPSRCGTRRTGRDLSDAP